MYHLIHYLFLSFIIAICTGISVKAPTGCGYDACNLGDPTKLNVHIIGHTHDDVGWLKTVDQYYYGAFNHIQHASVQYILDSIMEALDENPDRRFSYVESAFIWRWWNEQTPEMQNKVKKLVNEGRLELLSGGWCMNDEAATHYNSIIDQISFGAEFLHDQFGECGRPKIGWQIDPFGHSREYASILAQMGFDGLFIRRVDYQDHLQRNLTKTMEMIWKASANLDRQSWLFTGILPYAYMPPGAFCYDSLCSDPPIMDNPQLQDYNVPERVQTFIQAAYNQSSIFATNHIMMTMGSDFQYEIANTWYKNLDKLIKYVNAEQVNGSNVTVFYSTTSCYVYALNKAGHVWPSKSDDFFPYAMHPHAMWTGFYTSRPAFKIYERHSNNILQVTRQLNGFANANLRSNIFPLSEAMGLAQHHDAITGTEKQVVAFDYALRLSEGINAATNVINAAYAKLLPKQSQSSPPQFLCQLSNISECLPIEQQHQFTLTLWNPTVHSVIHHVRVPVTQIYLVRNATGQSLFTEMIAISNITKSIPGRNSSATNELLFTVTLPALGFNTYYFEATSDERSEVSMTINEACTLQNENVRVEIDGNGNLKMITNLKKNISLPFSNQGLYWYISYPGNNSHLEHPLSGAYIFRPLKQDSQPLSDKRSVKCINGQTLQMATVTFNDWGSLEFILYDDAEMLEVEWTVGPISIADNLGKEIILRYDTDIASQSKFYTDANGREVLERIRDYRPTWNYTIDEPVSGNYYPVNSRIWIKDANRQFTILPDRSEGGSSMHDGSIEIMLHRRILHDDSLGAGEPLNETAFGVGLVARGKHFLILETPNSSARLHRVASQQLYMHPLATYSLTTLSYTNYSASYHQTWSALANDLPLNVHLLTFDQLNTNDYLIRVEHYFELNEDEVYSQPVTFDLKNLFESQGEISEIVEMTLGGNLSLSDLKRLEWTSNDDETSKTDVIEKVSATNSTVTLNPMQIRTFRVTVA